MNEIGVGLLLFLAGLAVGGLLMLSFLQYQKQVYYKKISHEKRYLDVMHQWFILKENALPISDILEEYHISSVAIYGMGIMGRHVIRELKGTGIAVKYGIDQRKMNAYEQVPVFTPKEQFREVDAVINTVVWEHDKISHMLSEKLDCKILNLEELIFNRYGLKEKDI